MARTTQAESGNQNGALDAFPPHSGTDQPPKFAVRHYTIAEIAVMWCLSPNAVRKIFEKEPGILILGDTQPRRGKRRYTTLRVPEFVLERVHRRMSRT
jgi:hypothetical protein